MESMNDLVSVAVPPAPDPQLTPWGGIPAGASR
jgi:hypothetical protein